MDNSTLNLLKEARDVILNYKLNDRFRNLVEKYYARNPLLLYKNRPFIYYIQILSSFSPRFRSYFRKTGFRKIPEFLNACANDSDELNRLRIFLSSQQVYRPSIPQPLIPQDTTKMYATVKVIRDKIWDAIDAIKKKINQVKSTNNLAKKILLFQQELGDPVLRIRLLENNYFTEEEMRAILQYKLNEISTFKDEKQWRMVVGIAAEQALRKQTKILWLKDQKEVKFPQKPSVEQSPYGWFVKKLEGKPPNAPYWSTPSTLQRLTSKTQIVVKRVATEGGEKLMQAGYGFADQSSRLLLGLTQLSAFSPKKKLKRIFLTMLLFFGAGFFLLGFALPGGPTTGGGTTGGGNISQCTFYRSGNATPQNPQGGLRFRIQEWPALINEVASRVGIPSTILAALLRVECADCFYSDDPSYIRNDYDARSSIVGGQQFAYGVMQFYPPTFEAVFNRNQLEMQSLFGKTSVRTTIDPQANMASADVLRIYSIKDALIAAAYKIKNDAGSNPPYDRAAVERIVRSYFTQCEYTQGGRTFNYCDDVWSSMQSCQQPTQTPTPTPPITYAPRAGGGIISCPVNDGRVVTGSRDASGHCNPSFYSYPCEPPGSSLYTGRETAVDVSGSNRAVYLPRLGNQRVVWSADESGTRIQDNEGGGIAVAASAAFSGTTYRIRFVHLDSTNLRVGQSVDSETQVGTYNARANHVHITIQENGTYKPADLYFNLCR